MIISHRHSLILFSNPRTGSETVRAVFEPWADEPIVPFRNATPQTPFYPHMTPRECHVAFRERGLDFWSYRRITFVRNPYARLVSLYRMIADVDPVWRLRQGIGIGPPDFARWIKATKPAGRGGGGARHQKWRQYGTWRLSEWCADFVDEVYRTEELANVLPRLGTDYGIRITDVPRLNARPRVRWQALYTAELSALVAERYHDEMQRFSYPALHAAVA